MSDLSIKFSKLNLNTSLHYTLLKIGIVLIFVIAILFSPSISHSGQTRGEVYNFHFTSIDGIDMPMKLFKNKVILVVNTASKCGYTSQYDQLQEVWDAYKEQGLVIIGVPSNDFFQEPGDETKIKNFCELNFNINFPMTSKVSVVGKNAHEFYKWAHKSLGAAKAPKWNFHKYLLSHNGDLVSSFSSSVSPKGSELEQAIVRELAKIDSQTM